MCHISDAVRLDICVVIAHHPYTALKGNQNCWRRKIDFIETDEWAKL